NTPLQLGILSGDCCALAAVPQPAGLHSSLAWAQSQMEIAPNVGERQLLARAVFMLSSKRPFQFVTFTWASLVLWQFLIHFSSELGGDSLDIGFPNIAEQQPGRFAPRCISHEQLLDSSYVITRPRIDFGFAKLDHCGSAMIGLDGQIDMAV